MAVFRVRPTGFKFPVGLSVTAANTVVDYLVVAGGGGGGSLGGGGGGGGGFLTGSGVSVDSSTPYSITVGAGGIGTQSTPGTGALQITGTRGSNSSFGSIATSIGGGWGGSRQFLSGGSGGSGGGGGNYSAAVTGGISTPGQGNDGGTGHPADGGGGGGGGAGGAGGNHVAPVTRGAAGIGLASPFSGSPVNYAGGGEGSGPQGITIANTSWGAGGSSTTYGYSGATNRGGGGGSSNAPAHGYNGGAGGKGIVIVRYAGGQQATGGTVTSDGSYTIHTFTGDGTFATNADFRIANVSSYSIN